MCRRPTCYLLSFFLLPFSADLQAGALLQPIIVASDPDFTVECQVNIRVFGLEETVELDLVVDDPENFDDELADVFEDLLSDILGIDITITDIEVVNGR